jgi:hypothetical protein
MRSPRSKAAPASFPEYLRRCADRYPSEAAFARAIGISPGRMSRALAGQVRTFRVDTVLRLAAHCDADPYALLRAAGQEATARALERLFGEPRRVPARVHALISAYQSLDRRRQAIADSVMGALVELGPTARVHGPRPRGG